MKKSHKVVCRIKWLFLARSIVDRLINDIATLLIKNTLPLLLIFFLCLPKVDAQVTLAGVWEGTMTVGGIYSSQELPMELYLLVDGKKIEGRSYVRMPDGTVVQMNLKGTYHFDHSMSLQEVEFVGNPTNDYLPKFSRQYQMVWKADLWNAGLNGFWQEITEQTFDHYRRRGRIKLKKVKNPGA